MFFVRAAAVVLLAAAVSAQQPSFRAGAEVVPIFATVRGPDGHLVTGLTADDFELFDRGARVPVSVFSDQPQPLTLVTLVDMSGGGFDRGSYALLRNALLAFVDKLQPQDRARIGTFSQNEIALGYRLTPDHAELERVIHEEIWMGYGRRPLWNAVGLAVQSLSAEPGRRIVVVMANGPNTESLPNLPGVKDVEDAAEDPGLMVYGVSLFAGNEPLLGGHAPEADPRLALRELADATGGGYIQAVPIDPNDHRPLGGVLFGNTVDDGLIPTLANIVEELRHQYVLGFSPTHRDGKVGKIEVRVKRPKTTVSARKTLPRARRRFVKRQSLVALVFLVLSLGVARPAATQRKPVAPLSLVLVLDVSASVDSRQLELPRDISDEVDSVLLARLAPGDRFGVCASGATMKCSGLLADDRKVRASAVRASLKDRTVGLNGPSRIWDALDEAITALEKETGRRAIVLVTDGYATGNRVGLAHVIQRAQTAGVAVSVIANRVVEDEAKRERGPSALGSAWPLLEKLATETHGVLRFDAWGDTFHPRKPGRFFEEILAGLRAQTER